MKAESLVERNSVLLPIALDPQAASPRIWRDNGLGPSPPG
jgi:hypothetical protein